MALTVTPAELTATALTLTTAAQPNITSVGTLSGLTTAGITMSNGGDRALTGPLNQSLLINARPNDATEGLKLQINAVAKLSILQNGSVTIGGTGAPRTVGWGDTKLQIEGTGATDSSISIIRNEAGNNPPYFVFAKSRTSSIGSNTVVQDDDYLGVLRFNGADGTDLGNSAAQIHVEVDGTPATDDVPGALVFSTNAIGDGSSAASEKLRIAADGTTTIGRSITTTYVNSQGYPLHIQASAGNQSYLSISSPGDTSGDTGVAIGHDPTGTRIVNRENQPILFHTGSSSGLTFTMEANGDFSIADGNLVVASGHGIDFSATGQGSGTMSSELLDDYEEGTFNATIISGSGSISVDTTDDLCFYTKIGRLVTISGRIAVGSVSNPGGQLDIGNLPFNLASAGETSHAGAVACNIYNAASNFGGNVVAEMRTTGGARILIRGNGGTTSSVHAAAANIDADSIIGFTATYPTT